MRSSTRAVSELRLVSEVRYEASLESKYGTEDSRQCSHPPSLGRGPLGPPSSGGPQGASTDRLGSGGRGLKVQESLDAGQHSPKSRMGRGGRWDAQE